jgi:selenide,water dikinase
MGARPLTALQLVGWPRDELPFDLLGEVVAGGAAVLEEAGCVLVGGHSIDDREPKYGLAVTGLVHPDEIVTNRGAQPGDLLVLTKPIGTGLVATGIKQGKADRNIRDEAVRVMAHLNAGAAGAMLRAGARAATDITGFGLLGHLEEMVHDTPLGIEISVDAVPVLPGAAALAEAGAVPGGTVRNLEHAATFTDLGGISEVHRLILADAQTSGGLAVAVPPERKALLLDALAAAGTPAAAEIGRVVDGPAGRIWLA